MFINVKYQLEEYDSYNNIDQQQSIHYTYILHNNNYKTYFMVKIRFYVF